MTELPKKIYVDAVVRIEAGEYSKPSTTEYIRADIVEELVKSASDLTVALTIHDDEGLLPFNDEFIAVRKALTKYRAL